MTRRNEVVVGTVVLLSIALIIFGTIWMKGLKLGSEDVTQQARFREVGQLLVGSTVKFRGVPIGRVERIELERGGGAVIVTMTVDAAVTLPPDPAVILAPESMFGDWQAEIVTRGMFPTYAYTEATDADMLPGYSLPDMSRLTAVADEIARNLATISNRVELAFTEETALNIREAIDNIQQASGELASLVSSQQAAIDEVARNLERTSEAAGQAALTMQRAFGEVETAIGGGKLTNIVQSVERATARTDSLVSILVATSRELRTTAISADSTFRRVNNIAVAVERGEGSLGRLLTDTALFYSLISTNLEMQALLRDIRNNPRKYINLTIF
ncbi:MAG TPA: MlaD family protein [Longimicrobiales bacterium]|nr:MlaD family protein [Longimicrobiales bacterium]